MADGKPGRPEFKVTDELRDKVEWYVASGMTQVEVAGAIGCTVPTLVKHFSDNLEAGWARKKAEVIDLMVAGAKAGNASLTKHLDRQISVVGAAARFEQNHETPEVPDEKLGKKALASRAAQTAGVGSSWGADLLPGVTKN